jgi:predicted secreted Zn-dependent protease
LVAQRYSRYACGANRFAQEREVRRSTAVGVLALALALGVRPACSQDTDGVEVRSTITYYDVEGSTWADVQGSMEARRPALPGTDERWDGITSWRFILHLRPGDAPCRGEAVSLTLEVTVTMPQLKEGYQLSVPDQDRWARMERRLTAHEEGHVQIARDGARRMIAAGRSALCGDFRRYMEAERNRLNNRQAAYDRLTQHGAGQEAWERLQRQ